MTTSQQRNVFHPGGTVATGNVGSTRGGFAVSATDQLVETRQPQSPEGDADRHQPATTVSVDRRSPRHSGRTIELLGLALAIGLLVAATLARRLTTDVFWTLAAGQSILAHHSLFGPDTFTYTEPHRRWIADEWGSEVVLASLFKVFGSWAFNVFAIATGTLSLLCTMMYTRALGARGGRVAVLMVLLALGIAPVVTQVRGVSFSLIWLPLELLVLTKARENPRWLLWLPLLFVCWVNTHGSVLFGLFVLGLELAWSLAPSRWVTVIGGIGRSSHPGQLSLALVAGLVASCISPYGPAILRYDLGVASNSQIGKYIAEWQSPDFHSVEIMAFYLIPLLILFLAFRSRRLMVLEFTLTALCFVAALHSGRAVVYLFVTACGLAACLPQREAWGARARRLAGAMGIALALAVVALPAVPAGSVTEDTPVAAFNYLAARPGRIFTQQAWASYGVLRHRASFFDGRADYFSGAVFSDYIAIDGVSVNPDPILSKYDVAYVIWAPGTPLASFLLHDPKWRVIDRTTPAIVFARSSG
jgi:hypothetical protein